MLADLFDLVHSFMSEKLPKPYPRPWPDSATKARLKKPTVSQDEVRKALRRAGHAAEWPTA